ncbi:DUF3016 domain-containing protein [Glaciecola sp. XM2]|jgi:hypothetical protein|uniref:DUF3016 domain-containing protein n=1 Tax=Glaciecola sp. XM2 TaxID=1914931 RepID=UPI001BDE6C8C|nr:DUF3016 domain-containing protein [Glaciecola sp. XM2]MBT1450357.1 DUF3016 domain-containing protein [Glaciecola sp. XM2]
MKTAIYVSLTALAFSSLFLVPAASAYAEQEGADEQTKLKIEFIEPKKYTDIRPSNQSRSRFTKQVTRDFEAYFSELAEQLPDGQSLNIKVTDIDLAGDTLSARFPITSLLSEVRVIEDIFFPSMDFEYELKNANGDVVQSDIVELKDMNFMNRSGRIQGRDAFPYEKHMIDRWFSETFLQTAALNQ